MLLGNALFVDGHLSDYLHAQNAALAPYVENIMASQGNDASESELVSTVLEQAAVVPLSVAFDKVTKDVQPAKIRMNDYGRDIEIDGVSATRTYPFTGESEFFRLRPNTFTSVIPYGVISRGSITIGVQGANEPDRLKTEMQRQEGLLRQYVDWQCGQVEEHNRALRPQVERLVGARRKHLEGVAKLKDLL
jgi:prepilin-type processing-associated H-X9-DG protein